MFRSLSELSEINPNFECPNTLDATSIVSFIPMGDVSDSGHWTKKRTRPLKSVQRGFTPFTNGDVLFAKITPCMENGKGAHVTGLANDIGFGSTEFHVLRPKLGTDARFLFHHSQHQALRLAAEAAMTGSAGQKRVPTEFFHKWKIYSPKKREQSKIAEILDTLDTQIQKTEALIAKLEKIKKGLLHDLLTRGIDQNGQLRPTPEQAPELYKESILGLIPREWDVSEFGTVTTSSVIGPFGSDLVASDYRSEGVPVVFVRDIAGARYDRVSRVCVSHKKALALSAHEVKTGDLLLTKMGLPPCISAVYPENEPAGVITADIIRLRLNASVIPKWAQHFVNSEYVKAQVRGITAGVTRPKVTLKDVRSLKIAIPSTEEQARILDILQRCSKRMNSERAELSKLQSQKSGLMDDLLTGRVRVTPLLKDAG